MNTIAALRRIWKEHNTSDSPFKPDVSLMPGHGSKATHREGGRTTLKLSGSEQVLYWTACAMIHRIKAAFWDLSRRL
jgi:hypothetical protein